MGKNKAIRYGKESLLANEDLDPKKAKIRISIMLDGDLLAAVKTAATLGHKKYQTLINETLRDEFLPSRGKHQGALRLTRDQLQSTVGKMVTEAMGSLISHARDGKVMSKESATHREPVAYKSSGRIKRHA